MYRKCNGCINFLATFTLVQFKPIKIPLIQFICAVDGPK